MKDLKILAIRGIKWNALSISVVTLLQILQTIVLARLLDPSDFGKMAMIWVVLRLASPFSQGGISQAIIQAPDLGGGKFSSLFWFNLGVGTFIFGFIIAISPIAALYFREPQLPLLLIISGITIILGSWGAPFQAVFTRNLEFKKLAGIQISSHFGEFILAVALALMGAGVWSFVGGSIVRSVMATLLSWIAGWKANTPRFFFRWEEIRPILRFGAYESGSLSINVLNVQIDKIIIGRLLGPHSLGLYTLAWELIVIPAGKINSILTRITYPVFSRIQQEAGKLNRYFINTLRALIFITFPLLAGLSLTAKDFLREVFGGQWEGAGVALSILAIAGIFKAFTSPAAIVLLAKGRADILFYWNVAATIVMASLLWLSLYLFPSLETAAWIQALAAALFSFFWYSLICKYGRIEARHVVKVFLHQLFLLIPMISVIVLVQFIAPETRWNLIMSGCFGVLAYALTLLIFKRPYLREMLGWVKSRDYAGMDGRN
jgi:O-antigen/teichoic acid export membrane protein